MGDIVPSQTQEQDYGNLDIVKVTFKDVHNGDIWESNLSDVFTYNAITTNDPLSITGNSVAVGEHKGKFTFYCGGTKDIILNVLVNK